MRTTLIDQIIKRRKALKIRSSEMTLLAGINRQQYEKIEKSGNPSLITLDKISEALDAEMMLIPKEKLVSVKRVLADPTGTQRLQSERRSIDEENSSQGGGSPRNKDLGADDDDFIVDPWSLIEGKK